MKHSRRLARIEGTTKANRNRERREKQLQNDLPFFFRRNEERGWVQVYWPNIPITGVPYDQYRNNIYVPKWVADAITIWYKLYQDSFTIEDFLRKLNNKEK